MWYEIKGFPRYLVSDDGKVMSKMQTWSIGKNKKVSPARLLSKSSSGTFALSMGNMGRIRKAASYETLWALRGEAAQ